MNDFIAGCVGGIMGTFAVYPLDTWRVRKQSNIKMSKNVYSGVLTPLIGVGLEKSIVFGSYGVFRPYLHNDFCSGLLAGGLASLIVTPIEKWKIMKQNNPSLSYRQIIPSSIRGGVRPLYNGLSACFLREIPGYAMYFQSYSSLHTYDPLQYMVQSAFLKTFIYGGMSGISAWVLIYPFDTIKTNMQYHNTSFIMTTKRLLAQGTLYNGFGLGLIRAFTLHSFVFLGYDIASSYLSLR